MSIILCQILKEFHAFDIFNDFYSINMLCDLYNIPFASNIASAELLIKALERGDLDWRKLYKH